MEGLADMSQALAGITGWEDGFHWTPAAGIVAGLYALCLLAGLALDGMFGVRWLSRWRRGLAPAPDWPRSAERLRRRPWTWREAALILIALLAALAALRAAAWLGESRGWPFPGEGAAAALWHGLALHGVCLAALAWSVRRRRLSLAEAFGIRGRDALRRAGQGALIYLAILPPLLIVSLVYQAALYYGGCDLFLQDVVLVFLEPQTPGVRVGLLILVLLIAPASEEALFRGVILPLLARSAGPGPAVLLTAAGFALIHFHLPALAPLFVLAVGFALAYIATGSLLAPLAMHALFNGMNVGLVLLAAGR